MQNPEFKSRIRENINQNITTSKTEELLKTLGLFPLPENVEVTISSDNKYLNLRLKDSNGSTEDHLLFQILLKGKDLSALQSSEDYQELLDRYNTYTNEYIDEIKNYAIQERAYIEKLFPNLVFSIKIRIKSYESYLNKINKNVTLGKSPYINDIMAERIIISSMEGSQDEEKLTQMCYEVAKALYDFRLKTNFSIIPDKENNAAPTSKEYITKDYIACPKENGYQSLHILMQNKNNNDFKYETQIRTFEMEDSSKNDEKKSHKKYKPRLLNDLSVTRIPLYSIITQFNDSSGVPIIIDAPFKTRFYHFYNNTINSSNNYERHKTITYEMYKKELSELTESLGMSFKNIRARLRKIDISKYVQAEISRNSDPLSLS